MFARDGDEEAQPLRELYSVFFRPRAARDGPARTWAESETAYPSESASSPVVQQARLILEGAGLDGGDLVAAPTATNGVCVAIFPTGPGGCGEPTLFGLEINGEVRGSDTLVYGLVADEVRGVDVVIDGASCAARMGENGFACAFRGIGSDHLERIVLQLEDGSVETVPLGGER